MRCAILCCAILAFGCGKIEEARTTRIGKATNLINAIGTPKSAEIMVRGNNGMSDLAALNEEQGAKFLKLFSECFVIKERSEYGPSPGIPPPGWIVTFKFGIEPELRVAFRGCGPFIRARIGDSFVILDPGEQNEELVELLELQVK